MTQQKRHEVAVAFLTLITNASTTDIERAYDALKALSLADYRLYNSLKWSTLLYDIILAVGDEYDNRQQPDTGNAA